MEVNGLLMESGGGEKEVQDVGEKRQIPDLERKGRGEGGSGVGKEEGLGIWERGAWRVDLELGI